MTFWSLWEKRGTESPVVRSLLLTWARLLLSQSVLSSFSGAENENNIVTYKETLDHKLSPFLCQVKAAAIVLDKSDFLGGGKKLLSSPVRCENANPFCLQKENTSEFLSSLSFLHVGCH